MSAIAGSVSLSAAKARGLGFKQSAPMGSRVAAAVPAQPLSLIHISEPTRPY